MRIHTFAAPEELQQELCTLSAESSHHLARVLRVQVGQAVSVFDGQGHGADAKVESVSKSCVVLRITERWQREPHRVKITLIQALPKGAKLDLILQKAVELGCSEIIPLQTQNAIVKLKAKDAGQKRERWEKIILNAAEQCGTCWLPEIAPLCTVNELLPKLAEYDLTLIGALDEETRPLKTVLREADERGIKSVAVLIGPEGDFTPEEMQAFREAGATGASFGTQILRTETAALFALSALSYELL
ncbi:16S rRNA (uracil(1498)-N(3))-methyltransferase [Verrucomicrobiota bacterium]